MTKFLSVLSLFLLSFGIFNISYAACGTINLSCTQDLELSWTSTGQDPFRCDVRGDGIPGFGQCNSQSVPGASGGWVKIPSANIPQGTSEYTFQGVPISGVPPQMVDTCTVVKPTNCAPTASYSISASPNPVQICSPETQATTNISWNAPAGQAVVVYQNGTQVMSGTGSGSGVSSPITLAQNAVFTLRKASTPSVVEGTVTVAGTTSGCSTNGTGYCGDSTIQTPNAGGVNEQCDLGSQNGQPGSVCNASCQTVPTGGTCGDGIVQSPNGDGQYEECDMGGSNGSSGGSCSAMCLVQAQSGTPFVNIGFDSSYTKVNSAEIPVGSTHTQQVFVTSADVSPVAYCSTQKNSGSGWVVTESNILPNTTTSRSEAGLSVGTHQFRYVCSNGAVVSPAAILTVTNPVVEDINIGWGPSYSPKSKSVTVASGQTSNETLYVTTGGRPSCSISGYMNSGNQAGVTPVSTTSGFGYVVNAPESGSVYTYTLNCAGQTSVSATLSVGSGAGTFSCQSNQCVPCGGSTGIECNGTGLGCTTAGESCSTGTQNTYACINNTCSTACGGSNQPACTFSNNSQCSASCGGGNGTLDAQCLTNPSVTPTNVRSGQTFSVSVPFTNTGTKTWNPSLRTYAAYATSNVSGWNTFRTLTTLISGTPTSGTFTPNISFVAPSVSTQTSFSLSFRMAENGTLFGRSCAVNGTGFVVVDPAQCSDGIDNADPEDTLADALDPGCWTDPTNPGTYNPNDDNEQDPSAGSVLRISANPQLVRQGGSADVTYEVSSCNVMNNKGALVPGTWTLVQDGVERAIGTETSNGAQTYPVYDIQSKTTFVLSCGGSSRSATISVIKINEI